MSQACSERILDRLHSLWLADQQFCMFCQYCSCYRDWQMLSPCMATPWLRRRVNDPDWLRSAMCMRMRLGMHGMMHRLQHGGSTV